MILNRKVVPKILKRALRKCSRMYANGLYAYCTPVEYLVLSNYFNHNDENIDYMNNKIKHGISGNVTCYIKVNNKLINLDEFPNNKYTMKDVNMI